MTTINTSVGPRGTGLLIPPKRQTFARPFAEISPGWTKDQVIERITDPSYIPRSQIFDDSWIYNQGSVGSCNGFAGAQAVERARWFRGLKKRKLSGVGLYSMVNGGQDRGSMLDDAFKAIQEDGVPPDDLVPQYEWRKSRIDPQAFVEAQRYKAWEPYAIESDLDLATAIACNYPCVVAVHAGGGDVNRDGIVTWGNGPGNHAVTVDDVRWARGRFEYRMPNSWGLNWGVRGIGWLVWGAHLSAPIRNHYFYAVSGAIDDPQEGKIL